MLLQHSTTVALGLHQFDAIAPELGEVLQRAFGLRPFEQHPVAHMVREHEPAAARQVRVSNLQVGVLGGDIVVPRQTAAQVAVALLVVDGGDTHGDFPWRRR